MMCQWDFKRWWSTYFNKSCLSQSSMEKIPKNHKTSFSPSKWITFEYDGHYPGQVRTEQFIDGLVKETFSFLHTFNQKPMLPTELAYSENQVPINEKIKR